MTISFSRIVAIHLNCRNKLRKLYDAKVYGVCFIIALFFSRLFNVNFRK